MRNWRLFDRMRYPIRLQAGSRPRSVLYYRSLDGKVSEGSSVMSGGKYDGSGGQRATFPQRNCGVIRRLRAGWQEEV